MSRQCFDRLKNLLQQRPSVFAVLAFAGCSSFAPAIPDLPKGAMPMEAPTEYREWFASTEGCSGLQGQLDGVQWFVVPDVDAFETPQGAKVGMWEKTGGITRIIIAGNYRSHEMVVRHEMLHHLLDREGHPGDYFVERCHLTWDSWQGPSS